MKLKPSTLGFLAAALVLGGIVAIVSQQPAPQSGQQVSEQESQLFEFQESDVQAFTLQTQLRTLKFERNPEGKWQMLEPEKTAASDASVAFLLDLVATSKTPRTITAPASDRQQYGLHQPIATLDLTLKDQKTHRLVIGEYDFNRAHLYAQADPPPENQADPNADLKVLLVSPNFDQAVNRPLEEWKQAAPAAKSSPAPSSPSPGASPASPSPAANPEASPLPSP